MQFVELTRPQPLQSDDLLCTIVGITAAHVPGVASVGDSLFGPGGANPASAVTLRRWQEDLWITIRLEPKPGAKHALLQREVIQRVYLALENLLDVIPTGIELEFLAPAAAMPPLYS